MPLVVCWIGRGVSFRRTQGLSFQSANGVPNSHVKTLEALRRAFEEAGIEFIGSPDDAPGVRLRK